MQRRTEQDPRSPLRAGAPPARSTWRRTAGLRRLPRLAALLAHLLAALLLLADPAAAAPGAPIAPVQQGDDGYVAVVEVSGLLDRVLVDFVATELHEAEEDGALALVLQLNSKGAVVDRDRLEALADRIAASPVPVHVWVGPSGSRATGDATLLVAAADVTGISPGSRIEVTRDLVGDRSLGGRAAVGDKVGHEDAAELELVDNQAETIGAFVIDLPGVETRVVGEGEERRQEPVTPVRFGQLPLAGQLLHTVASPPVAYLLFVIGLALILFELYTAGVGVAGLVGAGSLVLGCYGLAALPTNPWAVALLLLAMFGYGVDVQTGVPRVWSGIATVAFVVGSVVLYGDGLSLSWVTLLVAIVGMSLAMLGGMPAMVRTRFSTPTIGREWMVGEVGTARSAVSPDGVVLVRGAPWRAHTSRVTPIDEGAPVRVVSLDGLVLQVEPIEGDEPAPDVEH